MSDDNPKLNPVEARLTTTLLVSCGLDLSHIEEALAQGSVNATELLEKAVLNLQNQGKNPISAITLLKQAARYITSRKITENLGLEIPK